jgi:hypothetical protein
MIVSFLVWVSCSSVPQASYDLNFSFKNGDEVVTSEKMKFEVRGTPIRFETKTQHICSYTNSEGVQTIDTEILEGFVERKKGDETIEKDDLAGETNQYFRNSYGESFDYEEVRATLKEAPFQFLQDEILSTHKRRSVVTGETWQAKSAHTQYTVTVGRVSEINGVKCIKVTRAGVFKNGIVGEYTSEAWYRQNGLIQSMVVKAKNVAPEGYALANFEMTTGLISYKPAQIESCSHFILSEPIFRTRLVGILASLTKP